MAHTPGPWVPDTDADGKRVIYSDRSAIFVAQVETADDLALLVAAPDMLAALREALVFIQSLAFQGEDHTVAATMVYQAIVKAEGR